MKKTLIKSLLCSFALLFSSCDLIPIGSFAHKIDLGYPETVNISNEGGEVVLNGYSFVTATIVSSKDPKIREYHGYNEADSTEYYVFDWLRVEHKFYSDVSLPNELRVFAEPNTTGKSRKLYIHLMSGDTNYQEIKVEQKK
jgi:hypothetical protein